MSSRRGDPPPIPEPLAEPPSHEIVPCVDAHTHLDACGATTVEALGAALDRATGAGVATVVTTADDLASARWAAWAAGTDDRVVAAVGLHPTRSRDLTDPARAEIERLAGEARVVAVGETGLDDYWTTRRDDCADLDTQREAFAWHIDLAKRTGLPLVIHDRDAHDAILDVLDGEGAPPTVVFHCFSGGEDMARRCAAEGWYLSLSGTVTFRNAAELRRATAAAPRSLLLTETDAPFLTPHPFRGRPNEPYCVPHTIRDLAEVRDEDPVTLARETGENARRVFRLDEQPSVAAVRRRGRTGP